MQSEANLSIAHGFLTTYWPGAILLLIFLALTVWFFWRRHQRHLMKKDHIKTANAPNKALTVVIAVVAVVALGLGIGAIANAYSGYFPTVTALQRWATVSKGSTTSPLYKTGGPKTTEEKGFAFPVSIEAAPTRDLKPKNAWIYVPPTYDFEGNDDRYPTVILMHGAPGRSSDWFGGGEADIILDSMIKSAEIPPMIIISVDGTGGDFLGRKEPFNRPGGPQIESYVTQDVVRWADNNLRTIPDADHRVIGGMSAGGIGALVFALHSPTVFGGSLALLPYTKPYTKEITSNTEALKDDSPLGLIDSTKISKKQKFFLGQGTGVETHQIEEIAAALRAHGATVEVDLIPKLLHNWITARTLLPAGLKWMSEELNW